MATEPNRRLSAWLLVVVLLFSSIVSASVAAAGPLTAYDPEISGGGAMAGGVFTPLAARGPLGAPPPEPFGPPSVAVTFDGYGFDDNATENGGFLFIPPDPIGAAGTDRVISVVNAMIEARTKAGALLWRDGLSGFFSTLAPANAGFDPKIVYDHYEGRFVVITLERVEPGIANPSAGNTSRLLLAVSKTATPATATSADWWYTSTSGKFSLSGEDYWSDYPGFEVDEEAVYITNNLFRFAPLSGIFGGARLWILHKGVVGGFYGGGAATITVHDPYTCGGSIATTTMPALVFGAGGAGAGIGTYLVSHSGLTDGLNEYVQIVRVDNPLGAVSFACEFVSVGNIDSVASPDLPDAPQMGTATLVETNDRRAYDAVWRSDQLWLTTTINPNAGPDAGQATAHWFRLSTAAVPGPITLSDQGNIGGEDIAAGAYTWFPSVAVNSALDAMFGFAASAPTIFPGAYVTGREAGDGAGTVQASQTVRAGVDFYVRMFPPGTRNRWGDYSGIGLDPTNDAFFWVFNEYAATRGTVISGEDGRWGTGWGRVHFAGVTTPTPTTTVTPPPTMTATHTPTPTATATATPTPTPTPTLTATPTVTATATATPTATPRATCTPPPAPAPTATPITSGALKCKRAIAKNASKFYAAKTKLLQKCAEGVVKTGAGSCPNATTTAKIATAAGKLTAAIGKACGGDDKVCGGNVSNEEPPAGLGWPATCPNFEGSADPDCSAAITDCNDIAACIGCVGEAAVDQAIALYYDSLLPSAPGSALNKCQQAIGKASAKFVLAKDKAIQKCWDARLVGKHGDTCPNASAPAGSPADKAALAIAKADAKKITAICKACGGADKQCDDAVTALDGAVITGSGAGDDLTPAAIGFLPACPAVQIPGGTFCDQPVGTLADLVECVDCVSEFKVDCVDRVRVPEFGVYPCECNP